MRAVIDTNVWISALLNRAGRPAEVLAAYRSGRFTLVTADPLLDEIKSVLCRPRIANKYGITAMDADTLVGLLRENAVLVTVTGSVQVCRDPGDDVVIEAAMIGKADMVVPRDEDLSRDPASLQCLSGAGIRAMTVHHFLAALTV